jgi:hypothetical protein
VVEALFRLDEILSQKPCLILTDPNDFEIFLKLKRFATASRGCGGQEGKLRLLIHFLPTERHGITRMVFLG